MAPSRRDIRIGKRTVNAGARKYDMQKSIIRCASSGRRERAPIKNHCCLLLYTFGPHQLGIIQ